jgi:selenium-binding protein 1
MVEVSRDGRRVYLTNSLFAVDAQFYPDGIEGWMVKLDIDPRWDGARPRFMVRSRRYARRCRGGDASSTRSAS